MTLPDAPDTIPRADVAQALVAAALREAEARVAQIILDDVGYTLDDLGEDAKAKLSAIRAGAGMGET